VYNVSQREFEEPFDQVRLSVVESGLHLLKIHGKMVFGNPSTMIQVDISLITQFYCSPIDVILSNAVKTCTSSAGLAHLRSDFKV